MTKNEVVHLTASESNDADGKIVTYIWDFGDGSPELRTNKTDITHVWEKAGMYSVTLTVQDDMGGSDVSQIHLEVKGVNQELESIYFPIFWIIIIAINLILIVFLVKIIVRIWTDKRRGELG